MGNPMAVQTRTGSPALIRMINGLTQDFVDTIPGAIEDPLATVNRFSFNRYAEIGGREFVLSAGTIYERTAPATFVSRLAAVGTMTGFVTGFFEFNDLTNGAGLAILDNAGGGGAMRLHRYFLDTDTWSTVALGTSGNGNQFNHGIVYDNIIYAWGQGVNATSNVLHIVDPRGGVTASVTLGPGNGSGIELPCALVGYGGIVYALTWAGGVAANFYTVLGGVFVNQGSLPNTVYFFAGPNGSQSESVPALYEQDAKIYSVLADSPGVAGSRLFEYDPAAPGVPTEVTNTILHPDLRPGGGLDVAVTNLRRRFFAWTDNESPFGTRSVYVLAIIGSGTEGGILYRHEAGGNWVLVGGSQWNGGQSGITIPNGGSTHLNSVDGLDVVQDVGTPFAEGSGMVFEVLCFGDPGNADKYLRIWYSTQRGTPLQRGTTIAPTSGGTGGASVIANNQLEQVDADDGVTVFRLKHDANADGVPISSILHWEIEISQNPNP